MKLLEKPFEYLKKKDGTFFPPEIVRDWYKARAYVLNLLKDVYFTPGSAGHLHVVILDVDGADTRPLMLSAARFVAFIAHYVNFDDSEGSNRSVITLVSRDAGLKAELCKEEYLCNLPKVCKFSEPGKPVENEDSYIDIEIEIAETRPEAPGALAVSFADIEQFCAGVPEEELLSIDTRKAVYANRIYSLGAIIDNIAAEDIHSAKRYTMALNLYDQDRLKKAAGPLIDEAAWQNQNTVKANLSSIYCADCFESRALSIMSGATKKSKIDELWAMYNEPLSKSEHARWAVDKLLTGYRPLNDKELFFDERLSYVPQVAARKRQYRKSLKQRLEDPAHIDLCSYSDLRRINPDDLKYDSFLMLAIPKILDRLKR